MAPSTGELDRVLTPQGELLDLREASDARLAETIDHVAEARDQLRDLESAVSDEILDRLDRSATWTLRVREGDREWEIKAPSPSAGTEVYRADALDEALRELVAVGLIDALAAERALERTLTVRVALPWDADGDKLAEHIAAAPGISIAGVEVGVQATSLDAKPVVAGIKAVRKIPGTESALDGARAEQDPPRRKVSVKRR